MGIEVSQTVDASHVESARYALIRRLGFVFRHHLVVNLQPLNMVCQVMRHRLGATPLDICTVRDSVDQVERLVRHSIASSSDVVSWLTPDPQVQVALGTVVAECLSNVRSSFSFRGFAILYEEAPWDVPVSQVAVREVLTAALIAAADHAKGWSELVIGVAAGPDAAEISIATRQGSQASHGEQDAYRLLDWDDVQVLARSHGLQFLQASPELVKIRVPLVP